MVDKEAPKSSDNGYSYPVSNKWDFLKGNGKKHPQRKLSFQDQLRVIYQPQEQVPDPQAQIQSELLGRISEVRRKLRDGEK